MKIQLIFAPTRTSIKLGDIPQRVFPPLGVLYLAAYLRKNIDGLDIKITDGVLLGWDQTLSEITAFGPDIIFLSYITPCASSAYVLGAEIKRRHPEAVIAFGGPHATALPLEPFERSAADFVVVGEGELTAFELVRSLMKGKKDFGEIDGLYWVRDKTVVRNSPRQFIANLDDIPFPARDLIDIDVYKGWVVHRQTPETSVLFSRGCPFNCTFCTNTVWKSAKPWLRVRSPKNIADELELLKGLGIREVFDNADEFNCNMPHALAVCEELKKRKLGMTWKAQVRATPLNDELVRAMAEAGCWYVHLGIESGNDATLKGIRKNITLDQVDRACQLLKKYGIKVFGLFMLFNAWEEGGNLAFEGVRETNKTLDFAKRLIDRRLIDYMSCTITTPYPGSQLFEIAAKHNLIRPELIQDWDKWLTEENFIMELPGITNKDASRLYFRGSLLRSYCYLRSGNWGVKDIPMFFNRFMRATLMRLEGMARGNTSS